MAGRWLTGWTLTGIIATPAFSFAMNAPSSGDARAAIGAVLVGGTLAVSAGAWVSAKQAGRRPQADAMMAGGAYAIAALVFLGLLSTGTSVEYNAYSSASENRQFDPLRYTIYALLVFGLLLGIAMGKYYHRSVPRLILTFPAVALLAGVLTFYFALFLAGFNLLTPLLGPLKVPVGLVLGGFLGTLLPGRIVESQLRKS